MLCVRGACVYRSWRMERIESCKVPSGVATNTASAARKRARLSDFALPNYGNSPRLRLPTSELLLESDLRPYNEDSDLG